MTNPGGAYMAKAYLGFLAGGIDPETLTEAEWAMYRRDADAAIENHARGWAIALVTLRQVESDRSTVGD